MIRRRLRRVLDDWVGPDDDLVLYHGRLLPVFFVEANSRHHLNSFDDLPKPLRDSINYAETPEAGARPTCDLVNLDLVDNRREYARVVAARVAAALEENKEIG